MHIGNVFRPVPDEERLNKFRCEALWGELKETPEHAEMERLREEGSDVQNDAGWVLADTVPTTRAGAAALVQFVLKCEDEGHCLFTWDRDLDDETSQSYGEALMVTLSKFLTSAAG